MSHNRNSRPGRLRCSRFRAGSGLLRGDQAKLLQHCKLVEVLALRLDSSGSIYLAAAHGLDSKLPVRSRQPLTPREGKRATIDPLRLVFNGDRIALLDDALDGHLDVGESSKQFGVEGDHRLTAMHSREPWPDELRIVGVKVPDRIQVMRVDRRVESPYPVRNRSHSITSNALLATVSGLGARRRIGDSPPSCFCP